MFTEECLMFRKPSNGFVTPSCSFDYLIRPISENLSSYVDISLGRGVYFGQPYGL